MIIKVGDIIRITKGKGHLYEVTAVCLGGTRNEDLVELMSLTEEPGSDSGGTVRGTTIVPLPIIQRCFEYLYRRAAL